MKPETDFWKGFFVGIPASLIVGILIYNIFPSTVMKPPLIYLMIPGWYLLILLLLYLGTKKQVAGGRDVSRTVVVQCFLGHQHRYHLSWIKLRNGA